MSPWEVEFLKAMHGLSVLFSKELTKPLLEIYRAVLKELTVQDLQRAVNLWIENPDNKFFPLPAELKACLGLTTKQKAVEAAAGIVKALHKHGGTDETNLIRAKKCMGTLGWEVVQSQGGWYTLLSNPPKDFGIFQAQCRDIAISILTKEKIGVSTERTHSELPPTRKPEVITEMQRSLPSDLKKMFSMEMPLKEKSQKEIQERQKVLREQARQLEEKEKKK